MDSRSQGLLSSHTSMRPASIRGAMMRLRFRPNRRTRAIPASQSAAAFRRPQSRSIDMLHLCGLTASRCIGGSTLLPFMHAGV
jgi:hypothetical protein